MIRSSPCTSKMWGWEHQSAVWVKMVHNTRSNTSLKSWSSSLGLTLYLSREFKAQLPLTSVALVSSQHICKPDPTLSGQKPTKLETEGTTCEALFKWPVGFPREARQGSNHLHGVCPDPLLPLPPSQHTRQLLKPSNISPLKKPSVLGRSGSFPQPICAVRWVRQRPCGSGENYMTVRLKDDHNVYMRRGMLAEKRRGKLRVCWDVLGPQ